MALDGAHAWVGEGVDAIDPLAASSADIAGDDHAQWIAVNFRQRLAVHLPSQEDLFILPNFAIRSRHGVVKDIAFPTSTRAWR